MKTPFSIKTRLTAWYLSVITVLLASWGLFAYSSLSAELKGQNVHPPGLQIDYIDNHGNILSGSANALPAPSFRDHMLVSYGFMVRKDQTSENQYFTLNTPEGSVTVNQQPITANLPEGTFAWVYLYRVNDTPGVYRLVTTSQPGTASLLSSFAGALLVSLTVVILLAGLLGFFLMKKMLRPLDRIVSTAGDISGSDLSRRLNMPGKDELGRLAGTMDHMFERLEKAFIREKQFTADVSHELGTPLAVISGEAQLALQDKNTAEEYRQTLCTILERTNHLSSITRKLLFLARDDSNQSIQMKNINLSALLSDLAQDAEVLSESKNIRFDYKDGAGVQVEGDETLLKDLFLNLIDNAVKYTPENGRISMSLERKDGHAAVSIADNGAGIPAEHLPELFRRFYRVDPSRSSKTGGTGLGLAICQKIIEFHSGKITVESEVGKGSVFTVFLPILPVK